MTEIASSAVVDNSVRLGQDVTIGPGCVIEPEVEIGDGCVLKANVIVCKGVRLGPNNMAFSNCVLGEEPQIVGDHDPDTKLHIGAGNVFRECVTIHRGSLVGSGVTTIGDNCYFMIGSHVGHDCEVEDSVVIGNYSQVGGHCKVERNVWMSSFCGAHQFVTIGRYTYAGGLSGMTSDIPPFMRVAEAYPCNVRGLNLIGLQRAGVSEESQKALREAYRRLYLRRQGTLTETVEKMMSEDGLDENVKYLLDFLQQSFQHRLGRYRELFRHT